MRTILQAIIAGLCVLISQAASAQDLCKDVLAAGLFNTTQSINSSESQSAMRAYYCSTGYNEALRNFDRSQSDSSGGSAGGGYGPFSAQGDYQQGSSNKVTEENYNLWKSQNCGDTSQSNHQSQFNFFAQAQVAPKVVQAWSNCMTQRQGLTCWVQPYDEYAMLIVNFNVLGGVVASVESSFLNNGQSGFDGAPPGKIFPAAAKLVAGKRSVPLIRNKDGPIGGAFTLRWSGQTDQCDFYVPSEKRKAAASGASKPQFRVTKTLTQDTSFGCEAPKAPCQFQKIFKAEPGYHICRLEYDWNGYSMSEEDMSGGARLKRSRQSVDITVRLKPRAIPPAPPQVPAAEWAEANTSHAWGTLSITQIDDRATPSQRTAAECNIDDAEWKKYYDADFYKDSYGRSSDPFEN